MLIYNHNKEFIGIDTDDLRKLDLGSLSDLLKECSDFADLFIKKPGYIHNFKNFKWIDFVMHSDTDEAKALISLNGKTYSTYLKITTLHLIESPDEDSYCIELFKLHRLGNDESAIESISEFETSHKIPTELPSFDNTDATTLIEPDPLDVPPEITPPPVETPDLSLYHPDSSFINDTPSEEEVPEVTPTEPEPFEEVKESTPVEAPQDKPMLGDQLSSQDQAYIEHLSVSEEYKYDPQVAADELGLPVDLIEEFIGDFILQANEFHDELFESIAQHDFDNLKNLSHKLKGVAANLRIEDAFEVLTIVNNTHDLNEAEAHLKYFYNTIAKLEGKNSLYAVAPHDQEAASTPEVDPTPVDDEVYAFEATSKESAPQEEAQPATPTDDDLYTLDVLEKEQTIQEEPEPAQSDDDIYAFESASQEPAVQEEEPQPATEVDDDLYTLDALEKEQTIQEAPVQIQEDDEEPYALDDLLANDTFEEPKEENITPESEQEEPLPEETLLQEETLTQEEPESYTEPDEALKEPKETVTQPDVPAYKDIHYDTTVAAYALGIDDAFMQELKNDFIAHALQEKDALQKALEDADTKRYQQIALELKGISDNLRINDVSSTLEELIKSKNSKEASQHVNQFFHYLVQL